MMRPMAIATRSHGPSGVAARAQRQVKPLGLLRLSLDGRDHREHPGGDEHGAAGDPAGPAKPGHGLPVRGRIWPVASFLRKCFRAAE